MTRRLMPDGIAVWPLLCFGLLLFASRSAAEETGAPREVAPDKREEGDAEALAKRVDELESTVVELTEQLSNMEKREARREDDVFERDARLDDLADESTDLWRETTEIKKAVDEVERHPSAGYDEGFFISSENGHLRLLINGFLRPFYRICLQRRYEGGRDPALVPRGEDLARSDTPSIIRNGFALESARLSARVAAFEVVTGVLEIDYGATDLQTDPYALRLLDAYAAYQPFEALLVRAGQFKVPFDRETLLLENDRVFTGASLMTRRHLVYADSPNLSADAPGYGLAYEVRRASSFGRDLGAEVGGTLWNGMLHYGVGAFNGAGSNVENDNRDLLVAARLASDPLGLMTPGISDFATTARPLLSIGMGFAYDLLAHRSQFNPDFEYNSADVSITGDVLFKWMGASLLASLFYRHADHGSALFTVETDDAGNVALRGQPARSLGATAVIAYFHAKTRLAPALRYSIYNADLDRLGDHVHEVTAALNYHLLPRHLKLTAEYRGLFPANTTRSYLAPLSTWYANRHEITVMAEVSF